MHTNKLPSTIDQVTQSDHLDRTVTYIEFDLDRVSRTMERIETRLELVLANQDRIMNKLAEMGWRK